MFFQFWLIILSIEAGTGGQSMVAEVFGASRTTVRKGAEEYESGEVTEDAFSERGRKKTTDVLMSLKQILKPS